MLYLVRCPYCRQQVQTTDPSAIAIVCSNCLAAQQKAETVTPLPGPRAEALKTPKAQAEALRRYAAALSDSAYTLPEVESSGRPWLAITAKLAAAPWPPDLAPTVTTFADLAEDNPGAAALALEFLAVSIETLPALISMVEWADTAYQDAAKLSPHHLIRRHLCHIRQAALGCHLFRQYEATRDERADLSEHAYDPPGTH